MDEFHFYDINGARVHPYDLHQSLDDVNLFVFYEIWENREGLDLHFQQSYIREFEQLANEKLAEKPGLYKTRKIG